MRQLLELVFCNKRSSSTIAREACALQQRHRAAKRKLKTIYICIQINKCLVNMVVHAGPRWLDQRCPFDIHRTNQSPFTVNVGVAHSVSCVPLCDPMNCSTPGFPVLHHLSELARTPVYWVGDASVEVRRSKRERERTEKEEEEGKKRRGKWRKVGDKKQQEKWPGDFAGGPVAKTPCSQVREVGFNPWSGS